MFIPASSEFVALCQSQVAVLTQGLGAASGAVYLTEELVEGSDAKLIPVVVYPEATARWNDEEADFVLPEFQGKIKTIPRLLKAAPRLLPQASDKHQVVDSTSPEWEELSLQQQRQIILPLMHEGVVMGLLVTSREDRPWNEREKTTVERIARTLTIAYIMDQRRTWFEQELTQQGRYQAQLRDRLDDLLHQFRNPLTALGTFGKLLVKRLLPGDKNHDAASSIVRESDRLQELLQQFEATLDMNEAELAPLALPSTASAEASGFPTRSDYPGTTPTPNSLLPSKTIVLEWFSVTDVLEPLIASAKAIAQERNLELQAEISPNLPLVQGNAKGLREVLSNLIDNALKYTPAGGEIDIYVGVFAQIPQSDSSLASLPPLPSSPTSQRLAITISDTGPGIPPQDLEHLFERHYRGVQATTTIPGSGLGLAIAKELIEQMQGEIEVFSPAQSIWTAQSSESAIGTTQDHLGKGTTFIVWLLIQ
ncbi:GAF domain-containing sensor histidine kinase [Microcoleus sp. FACHB-SPT15]|uniref:GAF domain-containing sensor histidine kinase n=1 Tax=Microcoleus sp. FACHB-SPT15 TaxID=2692830 RepID=UPI00178186D1|nr:GAF domain-containing sensor histidine kinase [Microcoleus sp. FACHB-SPT15]MBD1809036.1 GAF domain-containing sensor histidine kinase [Microcoleus sp. FACHB-SPT15]